jgi:hypothetical protein
MTTSTKKKHRKRKGESSSSSPVDYRPSMSSATPELSPARIGPFSGPAAPLVYYSGELQEETEWPSLPSRKPEKRAESYATPRSPPPPQSRAPTPPVVLDDDVLKRLQQEFDDEDSRLRTEREALASVQPSTFTCAVCTDELREDFVARLPGCGHGFCRECLRTYTVSKLEEHRFPVLCPSCVADNTGKEPGGKSAAL